MIQRTHKKYMYKVIGLFRSEFEFDTREEAIAKCEDLVLHYAKGGIKAAYEEVEPNVFRLKA